MIREGEVTSADLQEHAVVVRAIDPDTEQPQEYRAVTPSQGDPDLLPLLEEMQVEITAEEPAGVSILSYILPWIIVLAVYLWLQRRMMGNIAGDPGGMTGKILGGRFAKPAGESDQKITFDDVAGQDQAKREVAELVDFLREPDRFEKVRRAGAPRRAAGGPSGHGQDPAGQGAGGRGGRAVLFHLGV